MSKKYHVGKGIIKLVNGDIVKYKADAIVCPTNPQFTIGNLGVSGAIKRAAGLKFIEDVDRLSELYKKVKTGCAYITTGGNIPAKYIIHAVCTDWQPVKISEREGFYSSGQMIREATNNALRVVDGLRLKSINFPALGAGMGGIPLEKSIDIMLDEFIIHLNSSISLKTIGLILYGEKSYEVAQQMCYNLNIDLVQ